MTTRDSKRLSISLQGNYREFESDFPFAVITVVNISRTGICFNADHKIDSDRLIDLHIRSEAGGDFHLLGKVIWCNKMYGTEIFSTGVKILEKESSDIAPFTAFYQSNLIYPPSEKHIKG